MSSAVLTKKIRVPKKVLRAIASDFKEREEFWKKIKSHNIYHIQDWQEVNFIPGGRYLLRSHYIFDADGGKAFFRDHGNRVSLISDEKEIKRLGKIVSRQVKYFREGVFTRRLPSEHCYPRLFELMLIMNDKFYLISRSFSPEKESERKRSEEQAIKILFDLIISSK